jgi:hypothetical protein
MCIACDILRATLQNCILFLCRALSYGAPAHCGRAATRQLQNGSVCCYGVASSVLVYKCASPSSGLPENQTHPLLQYQNSRTTTLCSPLSQEAASARVDLLTCVNGVNKGRTETPQQNGTSWRLAIGGSMHLQLLGLGKTRHTHFCTYEIRSHFLCNAPVVQKSPQHALTCPPVSMRLTQGGLRTHSKTGRCRTVPSAGQPFRNWGMPCPCDSSLTRVARHPLCLITVAEACQPECYVLSKHASQLPFQQVPTSSAAICVPLCTPLLHRGAS